MKMSMGDIYQWWRKKQTRTHSFNTKNRRPKNCSTYQQINQLKIIWFIFGAAINSNQCGNCNEHGNELYMYAMHTNCNLIQKFELKWLDVKSTLLLTWKEGWPYTIQIFKILKWHIQHTHFNSVYDLLNTMSVLFLDFIRESYADYLVDIRAR